MRAGYIMKDFQCIRSITFSKRKLLIGFVLGILSFVLCIICGGSIKAGIMFCGLFFLLGPFTIHVGPKGMLVLSLAWTVAAAFMTVFLSQLAINEAYFQMGVLKYCMGALACFAFFLLIYCFIGHLRWSIAIGILLLLLLSTVNAYVYSFRGSELSPIDFLSVGTAINVLENYNLFPMPITILYAWCMGCVFIFSGALFTSEHKIYSKLKSRVAALVIAVISGITVIVFAFGITIRHWANEGSIFNGCLLNFIAQTKELIIKKPSGYNSVEIDKMAANMSQAQTDRYPTIIAIMDESFADLSVVTDCLQTNEDVIPFISHLADNCIKGYALASVYGGRTANSEFEFLTGNTMAWLPDGSVPYSSYLKEGSYSAVSVLKQLGYECISMHPYLPSSWNRPAAYSSLGFDQSFFLDSFPQEKLIRDFVSDEEMFEQIIALYEERTETDCPLFLFGITMQNHGGYDYEGGNYTHDISLIGYSQEYETAEQYLSLIHETDRAVQMLIEYFQSAEEDVVIVFFGDHLPNLDSRFYEELHGGSFDTLDEQMLKYSVPFFVWTNYDIEEQYVELTSLNYLSSYMYEAAGIELPAYNQFLFELQKVVPAMNAYGYYSLEQDRFLCYSDAKGQEAELLDLYEKLQYNNLFDIENRNDVFFPTNP